MSEAAVEKKVLAVMHKAVGDDAVIEKLTHQLFKEHQQTGVIAEGMIPKLDNGFNALKSGVKKVNITNTQGLKGGLNSGTLLIT